MGASLKFIYTFIIYSINLTFGMGLSSFGPSLVDLKYIMNTSMERISFFSFFLSVGYLFGSLFGFLYKYLNRQIVITTLVVINAFAISTTPNSPGLSCLYVCAFLVGMCGAAWSNAKTVWLIELWQKRSAPVLHTCSFLFGVGTIIGPLIDEFYVTGEVEFKQLPINESYSNNSTQNQTDYDYNSNETASTIDDQDQIVYEYTDRRAKLMIPFLIIGSMQFIGAIMMGIMYTIRKYVNPIKIIANQTKESNLLLEKKLFDRHDCNKDMEESDQKSKTNSKRILLIGFVSIFLAFQMSSEVIYMQFSATYFQYIPLHLSAKMSALLMSSMGLTFTMGRGFSALVSMKIRPQKLICLHLLIVFCALFLLYCGQHSLPLVWSGAVIMSYGLSPIICSTYCFLAQYLDFKNRIGTILLFSAESLNLVVPLILGKFIEVYPQIFLLVLFLNIMFSSIVFVFILFIVRRAESEAEREATLPVIMINTNDNR